MARAAWAHAALTSSEHTADLVAIDLIVVSMLVVMTTAIIVLVMTATMKHEITIILAAHNQRRKLI